MVSNGVGIPETSTGYGVLGIFLNWFGQIMALRQNNQLYDAQIKQTAV